MAALTRCRRCGGVVLPDLDGDRLCSACGEYDYVTEDVYVDRLAAVILKAARQSAGQAKGTETKRRRRAERAA